MNVVRRGAFCTILSLFFFFGSKHYSLITCKLVVYIWLYIFNLQWQWWWSITHEWIQLIPFWFYYKICKTIIRINRKVCNPSPSDTYTHAHIFLAYQTYCVNKFRKLNTLSCSAELLLYQDQSSYSNRYAEILILNLLYVML